MDFRAVYPDWGKGSPQGSSFRFSGHYGVKHRFTIGADGLFRDRHGAVLGRVTAITVDVADGSIVGDIGGSSSTLENGDDPRDGGAGEGLVELDRDAILPSSAPAALVTAAINVVWAHYAEVMRPRNTVAGPEERKVIRKALEVASVNDCNGAISSCAASEYHMKRGPYVHRDGAKYNKLSQILKGRRGQETTRERIDFFLERAETNGQAAGVPTSTSAKIAVAKRRVLDGWQFPGDALVVSQGEEAATWLVSLGYRIHRDPETGRPMFTAPG